MILYRIRYCPTRTLHPSWSFPWSRFVPDGRGLEAIERIALSNLSPTALGVGFKLPGGTRIDKYLVIHNFPARVNRLRTVS